MDSPRLGLATFTLRTLETSLSEMIRLAAAAGFDGFELVHRIHEEFDPDEVNRAFAETGLTPVGVHVWLHELEADLPGLVAQYGAVGVDTFVVPYDPDSNFRTEVRLRRLVERLTAVGEQLEARGCHLLYHPNHWDMIPLFDGPVLGRIPTLRLTDYVTLDRSPFRQVRRLEDELTRHRNRLFDNAFIRLGVTDDNSVGTLIRNTPFGYIVTEVPSETMNFEIDVTFFVQQGYDPVEVLDTLGDRVKRVHAKDLVTSRYTPGGWPSFVNAGDGEVDFESVIDATRRNGVAWVLFENGHAVDPVDCINRGADHLRQFIPAEGDASGSDPAPTSELLSPSD